MINIPGDYDLYQISKHLLFRIFMVVNLYTLFIGVIVGISE